MRTPQNSRFFLSADFFLSHCLCQSAGKLLSVCFQAVYSIHALPTPSRDAFFLYPMIQSFIPIFFPCLIFTLLPSESGNHVRKLMSAKDGGYVSKKGSKKGHMGGIKRARENPARPFGSFLGGFSPPYLMTCKRFRFRKLRHASASMS